MTAISLPPADRRMGSARLAAVGLALLLPAAGHAQLTPPSAGTIIRQMAQPPAALSAPGAVLDLPAPEQQRSNATLPIPVRQLVIAGNTLIDGQTLHALVSATEGHSVTLGELQAAVEKITQAYQRAGYPIAHAWLPAQRVHDGVVRIEVTEPHYDTIVPTGHSRLRDSVTQRTIGVQPGEVIASGPLERGLLLLNLTPGVQVKGTLVPGATPGTSTLEIEQQDQPVLSGSLSENNAGNRFTGAYLTTATVAARNPFGFGSSLSANSVVSNTGGLKSGGMEATSLNLWDGLRVGAYGSVSTYRLGGTFSSLDQVGRSTQVGGDVTYPVILKPGAQLNVRLDVLNDWLAQSTRSTGNLSTQSILIERLSMDGVVADDWRGTTNFSLGVSHGDLATGTAWAAAQDAAGPRAAGSYEVYQVRIERNQSLPAGFTWWNAFSGQLASKNLDSSQQFYLGGPYGAMSYAVGDGGGDDGYLLQSTLSHELPINGLPGTLTGSVLARNGGLRLHHTSWPGARGTATLSESGVGIGLSWHWERIDLSMSYVRRVGANAEPGFANNPNVVWFDAKVSF